MNTTTKNELERTIRDICRKVRKLNPEDIVCADTIKVLAMLVEATTQVKD